MFTLRHSSPVTSYNPLSLHHGRRVSIAEEALAKALPSTPLLLGMWIWLGSLGMLVVTTSNNEVPKLRKSQDEAQQRNMATMQTPGMATRMDGGNMGEPITVHHHTSGCPTNLRSRLSILLRVCAFFSTPDNGPTRPNMLFFLDHPYQSSNFVCLLVYT